MTRRWGCNPAPIWTRGMRIALACALGVLLAWLILACAIAHGDGATARVGALLDTAPALSIGTGEAASAPGRSVICVEAKPVPAGGC